MSKNSAHSSGFHEEYEGNGVATNGAETLSPQPIEIISLDSEDELDNNNEESSPDRHCRGLENDGNGLRDSNETLKRQDTDESDNDDPEVVSDEIETTSRIHTNGE